MKLYHVTTQKKAKKYRENKVIKAPVRGFTTLQGAIKVITNTGFYEN